MYADILVLVLVWGEDVLIPTPLTSLTEPVYYTPGKEDLA